jgi:alginate O-acetyltransferase complex protein AlgJ
MRTYHFVTSFLFGAIILLMAGAAIVRAVPYDVPDGIEVVDGSLTRGFESHYDKVFPVKTFGTNVWGAIQYTLFGEGRSGVVVGRDGWLYTSEEFTVAADGDAQVKAHLDLIADVQKRLQAQGTQLTVALLPAKARLYPEYLPELRPATLHRDLYARVQHELQARGVRAPDLLTAMSRCKSREAVFLRTDTHWTPQGADCTAQALAAAGTVPVVEGANYQTVVGAPRTHQGDLMQFLPLAPYFSALLPQPDLLVATTTESQSGDLFGDAPAPKVALVGTSYSADKRWNFDGALRQNLEQDVLNMAQIGHGPFEPMLAYLDQPKKEGPAPAYLIWEIPERYLPISADKQRNKDGKDPTHENGNDAPAQVAFGATPSKQHAAR